MKKTLLITIIILTATNLYAQLGWQIGYINSILKFDNVRTSKWNDIYETYRDESYENGIQGGITYDLKFNRNLSFLHIGLLPAVTYSTSEFAFLDEVENRTVVTVNTFRNTLEIPVEVAGVIPVTKDVNVIVFIGPTLSIGPIILENMQGIGWYGGWYGQKVDLELGSGIGIQCKKVTLRGAYDWGVLKYGSNNRVADGIKISLGFNI